MLDQNKDDTDIKKQLDKIESIKLAHYHRKLKIEGIDPEQITTEMVQ
jgi:hypothetical protein